MAHSGVTTLGPDKRLLPSLLISGVKCSSVCCSGNTSSHSTGRQLDGVQEQPGAEGQRSRASGDDQGLWAKRGLGKDESVKGRRS